MIVAPIMFILIWLGNSSLLNDAFNAATREVNVYEATMSPNVYIGGTSKSDGFLSASFEYTTFKIVNGVPTPWNPIKINYSFPYGITFPRDAFGGNTIYPELVSPTLAYYDTETGQRQIAFYLPQIHYSSYRNELNRLTTVSSNQSVEIALSFDHPYTLTQVQKLLPADIEQNWYWVDAYNHKDLSMYRQSGGQIGLLSDLYGFSARTASGGSASFLDHAQHNGSINSAEQSFIDALTMGSPTQPMFRTIFSNLSNGHNSLSAGDVKIIGVIVSGTPTQLHELIGKPYIKASVMGAVVRTR